MVKGLASARRLSEDGLIARKLSIILCALSNNIQRQSLLTEVNTCSCYRSTITDLPAATSLLETRVHLLVVVKPVCSVNTQVLIHRAIHSAHNGLKSSEEDIRYRGQGGEKR
jgi:hypothetical protein